MEGIWLGVERRRKKETSSWSLNPIPNKQIGCHRLAVQFWQIGKEKQKKRKSWQEQMHYLSNLYPCSRDSARIVFVEVAKHPNKAAQNPNILKLSSVTDVRSIPPTIGIKEAQIRQSKCFLQTSHCKTTVQPSKMRQNYSMATKKY